MTEHVALEARIVTIEQLFALGTFVPAAVQRDFQWEQRDSNLLLVETERQMP